MSPCGPHNRGFPCFYSFGGLPLLSTATQKPTDSTSQHNSSSIGKDPKTVGMSSLRQSILKRNISDAATSIIVQSWSVNTHKQYQPYVAQWLEFCSGRQSNPYHPPIGTVLDFLVALHEKGLKYSTLNTARSAISAVVLPTNNHYWYSPSGVKIHERNLQV